MKKKITYTEFKNALKIMNEYKTQIETHCKEIKNEVSSISNISSISKFVNVTKDIKFIDTDSSMRLLNGIKSITGIMGLDYYNITINDFSKVSVKVLMSIRGFGKHSLSELKDLCFYAGVKLLP